MTRSLPILAALGGVVLLGAVPARARADELLRAHVPFSFRVGNATLPPGEYDVRFDRASMQEVLALTSRDGHKAALALTEEVDAPHAVREPKLVFEKEGSMYSLANVFDPAGRFGVQVLEPRVASSEDRRSASTN